MSTQRKSFREQFEGRIDMTDGSVVLKEPMFTQIQHDAFADGRKAGLKEARTLILGEQNTQHATKHAAWNSMCRDMAMIIERAITGQAQPGPFGFD